MAEFYAGDVFNRDGLACYATADSALTSCSAKSYIDGLTYVAGAKGDHGISGTIGANNCVINSYEPVALKTDVSEIENALKSIITRVAALEDSMPRKDNLRRELKTLNYKREL